MPPTHHSQEQARWDPSLAQRAASRGDSSRSWCSWPGCSRSGRSTSLWGARMVCLALGLPPSLSSHAAIRPDIGELRALTVSPPCPPHAAPEAGNIPHEPARQQARPCAALFAGPDCERERQPLPPCVGRAFHGQLTLTRESARPLPPPPGSRAGHWNGARVAPVDTTADILERLPDTARSQPGPPPPSLSPAWCPASHRLRSAPGPSGGRTRSAAPSARPRSSRPAPSSRAGASSRARATARRSTPTTSSCA